MKHVIFSGIQPSGQLHIGNYFGAIRSWLDLQKQPGTTCIFAIVDYHALTEGPDPKELEQRIFDTTVDFLAAGLNPQKSTIMLQSLVPEHTDLAWILNCVTPISWLERVPTFKEKAAQFKNNLNMGLMDYPILMAADILLYNATLVPVGLDQLPHLELAREIARSFNARYGKTFVEPADRITPTPKIMSLTDPTKKMSKSLGIKAYIALSDEPAVIEKKIASLPTATGNEATIIQELLKSTKEIHEEFKDITASKTADRQITTEADLNALRKKLGDAKYRTFMALYNFYMLLYIFASAHDRRRFLDELQKGTAQFSVYKKLLSNRIATYPPFVAFRKKRAELVRNPKQVEKTLRDGSARARRHAIRNLTIIKKKIGLA
ncbi:MAG: tryptophan--tRNA ligase [Patescibacteria group bacterium]|nr:tryptophan--tRNA ligase [Patescibacteria group bacterium]MDD5715813.1 tryptophan--tRNA ligase [Patescibacteria group bacterium]